MSSLHVHKGSESLYIIALILVQARDAEKTFIKGTFDYFLEHFFLKKGDFLSINDHFWPFSQKALQFLFQFQLILSVHNICNSEMPSLTLVSLKKLIPASRSVCTMIKVQQWV